MRVTKRKVNMKRILLVGLMALGLVASQADATMTINFDAHDLMTHNGLALAPTSTLCLLVVDINGNGITTNQLNEGFAITLGSTFGVGNDDIIVARGNIADSSGVDGLMSFVSQIETNPVLGIVAGKQIGMIWLTGQTLNDITAVAGWYGSYHTNAFVLPSDGGTVGYELQTESAGGSVPDQYGWSQYQIIPEPSSVLLVGVGLLSILTLRPRR